MIEYIQIFYYLASKLFYVLFFSFLYIPLFNKCNIKKKVKKNNKVKIISQPKSVLAFTYLILLFILFKCFTFKMILFIVISIIIGSLILVDRMSPALNENLYKFNKSYLMILSWKLLHTVFTIVNMITNPLFSIINNKMNSQLGIAKNFITQIANLDLSDGLGDNFGKGVLNINEEITTMSNMSDYINKSKKKEKNIESGNNNSEVIISDINTTDCITSSKTEMIKKISEINQADTENIEDITITSTEYEK